MKLLVKEGYYEADTLMGILYEVVKHRMHHLLTEGKWVD